MKRQILIVVLASALLTVYGQGDSGSDASDTLKFGDPIEPAVMRTVSPPAEASNLTIVAPDGKQARITFGDGAVRYSGELPVDESAKLLFEALWLRCK